MRILMTGTTSGIGAATAKLLRLQYHDVIELKREDCDLTDTREVRNIELPEVDCLINCAGGTTNWFVCLNYVDFEIINLNFTSPAILTERIYKQNPKALIVNVTSSYVDRYWGGAVYYSAAKKALASFRKDFLIDYPDAKIAEVRPGLTRQQYDEDGSEIVNYKEWRMQNPDTTHLTPEDVGETILQAVHNKRSNVYVIMPSGHTL